MSSSPTQLRQRAELTYKQNRHHGRHGWLRLTPAYSVRLVEKVLQDFGAHAQVVFDPFSGSGTTALCAAYHGKTGIATDINPFLIWLSTAKARHYEKSSISLFEHAAQLAAKCAANPQGPLAQAPPLSNIERWWRPAALIFLLRLKAAIDAQTIDTTLLKIAFCRTLMQLSNASFNHQSMSFKAGEIPVDPVPDELDSFVAQFLADVAHIAHAATDNPSGQAEYIRSDARGNANTAAVEKWRGGIDLVITSPPYPNRMSYIRELRPYMYWLQFLTTGREAGELDWQAIGGTWGVATSRLAEWSSPRLYGSDELDRTLQQIRGAHPQNGPLLANYVHKYFEDMFEHLRSLVELLNHGATLHYIIGNSIFYGNLVAAETYLADQMAAVGLHDVQVIPIRKRNSKKGLIEFHVMGAKA